MLHEAYIAVYVYYIGRQWSLGIYDLPMLQATRDVWVFVLGIRLWHYNI